MMFKTKTKGDQPYVPTLEETSPELKTARADLRTLIERIDKVRAEYDEAYRACRNFGPAIFSNATAEQVQAFNDKAQALADAVNAKRAEVAGLTPVLVAQTEALHTLERKAREKITDQLRPYYTSLVRDYALGYIRQHAETWVAAEKLRQLHAEIAAQDVTPPSWTAAPVLFSQLSQLHDWAFDRPGTAVATVMEAKKEVDRLVAGGVLTADDIKTIAPELAKIWRL